MLAEVIRCISLGFQPLMPTSAAKILDQLKVPATERDLRCIADPACRIKPLTKIEKPEGVFPRLDVPEQAAKKE